MDSPEPDPAAFHRLVAGTARLATATGVRQVLSVVVLALTAATVARCLGPQSFGVYSGGTAAYNLLSGLLDFGFSMVLVRELTRDTTGQGRLVSTAMGAQALWASILTVALVVLGVVAGGTRGLVMLVLAPALALSALSLSRQLFTVRFRASPLVILDLSTTVVQCLIMAGLAISHAPIITLAVNLGAWSVITGLIGTIMARRLVTFARPRIGDVTRFLRRTLPVGTAALLASLYFSIDLTLLGWLTKPVALGHYAAAVRILLVLVTIPGFIMAAGMPGLSRSDLDPSELSRFVATLAHWIVATALPMTVGVLLFARPIVLMLFGHSYLPSVSLVRILLLAGALSMISNLTGFVLVSQSVVRVQVVFNAISLAVNVAGNIILVPQYGVTASAWLTVASEAIVVGYGLFFVRRHVSFRIVGSQVWRTLAALAAASCVAAALERLSTAVAIPAFVLGLLLAITVLKAWPEVITRWWLSRRVTP